MAVKNFSSRIQICGRSASCHGGHNAVEQSAYISRETMYCEYDGKTYYPKYSEDLVHTEVLLPENAPKEYSDPKVLWNAVEMAEKVVMHRPQERFTWNFQITGVMSLRSRWCVAYVRKSLLKKECAYSLQFMIP